MSQADYPSPVLGEPRGRSAYTWIWVLMGLVATAQLGLSIAVSAGWVTFPGVSRDPLWVYIGSGIFGVLMACVVKPMIRSSHEVKLVREMTGWANAGAYPEMITRKYRTRAQAQRDVARMNSVGYQPVGDPVQTFTGPYVTWQRRQAQ